MCQRKHSKDFSLTDPNLGIRNSAFMSIQRNLKQLNVMQLERPAADLFAFELPTFELTELEGSS